MRSRILARTARNRMKRTWTTPVRGWLAGRRAGAPLCRRQTLRPTHLRGPYLQLKARLLVAHQLTDYQRVEQIFQLPPLRAQKP
jgi:hypothetical protein